MSEPVMFTVDLDDLNTLIKAAAECADDLEIEMRERYPEDVRATYASQQRRYERDMTPVHEVRVILQKLAATVPRVVR